MGWDPREGAEEKVWINISMVFSVIFRFVITSHGTFVRAEITLSKKSPGMMRASSINYHNLWNVQTVGEDWVQSAVFVVCGLRHMLSQSEVIRDTTWFFGSSVLGFVNMKDGTTNNSFTVKVIKKKVAQFFLFTLVSLIEAEVGRRS